MKTILTIIFCLFLTPAWALVDGNATNETQSLYSTLQSAQGNFTYYGQFDMVRGTTSDVYSITGKYPYVYSYDYDDSLNHPWIDVDLRDKELKRHYRNGGIISLSWHMPNFTNLQNSRNTTGDPVVNILPGGANRTDYLNALDEFASWANNFTDDGGNKIPFMFRPFHECETSSFWWGNLTRTDAQYITLWQDLVDYLRDTKGVHNIIYVFSPAYYPTGWLPNGYNFTYDGSLYPGDDYVDVMGMTGYTQTKVLNMTKTMDQLDSIAQLHGKVWGYDEGCNDFRSNQDNDWWNGTFYGNFSTQGNASRASYITFWSKDAWGANSTRSDNTSFLTMSQNPKIKFLQYYGTHIYNATIRNGSLN